MPVPPISQEEMREILALYDLSRSFLELAERLREELAKRMATGAEIEGGDCCFEGDRIVKTVSTTRQFGSILP